VCSKAHASSVVVLQTHTLYALTIILRPAANNIWTVLGREADKLRLCHACHAQVHLLLCLDQYSRWNMDSLAREAFLFLKQSQPLQLSEWPGYTPRRGLLDGSFPTDRSAVYTFELQLPPLVMRNLPDLQRKLKCRIVEDATVCEGLLFQGGRCQQQ